MFKKSQAALEFLTTYAWAFLVILIMIGALVYFGILNPSRLLPDRCSFGSEFECLDFQIDYGTTGADGIIRARLKNNVGDAIRIQTMTVTTEAVAGLSCTGDPIITDVWGVGEIRDFAFTGCDVAGVGFVAGEKGKVSIAVNYYAVRSGTDYAHEVNGEIFSTLV